MKCPSKLWCVGVACIGTFLTSVPANATTVFENTTGDLLWNFDPGTNEVGDEILLAGPAGANRIVTNFVFQYWSSGFSGDETARIRFYVNDGALSSGAFSPGTLLYDSGPFPIVATSRSTLAFDFSTLVLENLVNPGQVVIVPDIFTWTVQFSGVTTGEAAGVSLYNPPTVGWDYNSYWDNDPMNGGWLLKTNILGPLAVMNFAARVEAVPEPNAVALGIGGALLVLLLRANMRKN